MAVIRPFEALRPLIPDAARIAAVPYDVVSTEEARALADGNPLSFLHVSRAEIDVADSTGLYADAVYERAAENFARLRSRAPLVTETMPALYFYRLRMGGHQQTGLAACYSLDEYDRGTIRKHERTRPDKEADRTRHMIALRAQTGPVFLTYRASKTMDEMAARAAAADPLFDFESVDGIRHTIWRVTGRDVQSLVNAFRELPCLYIADGHHRAASASRTRQFLNEKEPGAAHSEADWMLAVAFPDNQTRILPYNRVVRDLAGLTAEQLLAEVRGPFRLSDGSPSPTRRGEVSMYLAGNWYKLHLEPQPGGATIGSTLDVSRLQDQVLGPVLGIVNPATDRRIEFVGGIRGTAELEGMVDQGKGAVAFSMFPVGVDDLMRVADAGEMMPPKSTWFEPKLRDGLLIHVI